MNRPPLDAWRFDDTFNPPVRVIWTAKSIGARIGRGEDFVRDTLSKLPGSPIQKIGHRYCVTERELLEFIEGNAVETPKKPA